MEAPATAITQPRSRPQSSIPERKQNSQNVRLKSQLKSSSNEAHSDVVGDYRDASWFKAGEGDLIFAQWLLGRCNGVEDATTPKSEAATQRMFALFKTQRRLRQELALGSKREVVSVEEEEEEGGDIEGEEECAADAEEPLWCIEELVEQVGDVLRPSRRDFQKQQREAEKNNAKVEGAMERIVVAEVVDNATELILSRATREHETLLRRWVEVLKEEEAKKTEEGASDFIPEVEGKNDEVTPPKSKKRDKKEKKARVKKNKFKVAEDTACELVESFLTFLRGSAATQTHVEACVTAAPSKVEKLWMSELQRIVEVSSIEPEEEARRLRVASDIQTVLRHGVSKWRHCEVILFGSSMTHYGSRTSDLDMCLLPHGRSFKNDSSPPNEMIGKRQLQRLIDGKATENGHVRTTESEQLLDLHAQTHKSIEKLTQALNSLDRSGKNGDKQTKQRRQLEFFNAQMRLLRSAILADLAKLGVAEPSNDSNASGKAAHLKAIIADSRRQSKDLYLVRAILERAAKCEVRHVIAGARVPIIRFLHTRSGRDYECDLCFDNVLATWNTPLLRAYASFDDRARTLGLAVKHWAKQRGISDASMGFLSSYSFVLLSIYYLQVVRVLPNLQAPGLLQSAQIQPQFYNDINIAFCEDRAVAQAFLERSLDGNSSDMSLATLLVGFFAYYATQFDFAERVVTVRSPETPALKLGQWGSRKAKTWRMSIQDPLETGRDLGCVLQFKGQERIIHELRRAHELLARGESFSDEVCAVEKPAGRTGKAKQSKQAAGDDFVASEEQRQPNQQQNNKMKRSYVMVLQSADEELTKEIIEALFKDFQKSFRVGKVEEAAADGGSENKNKRWEVELLTQAQNCPRKLSLRTRIDWKAADGRVGRVWVHHQALFATPPCHKCLSPEHWTGKCVPDDLDEVDDDLKGDNDELHIPQKNIRRHVLRVAIGGDHSSAGKKNDRRKKKQQQHGAARDSHHTGQPKGNNNVKRRNSDKSSGSGTKESHGDKKAEATEVTAVRRVETVEKSSSTSRFKGDSNKTTQKKKKWQQRAHRKRGDSKRDSNNAAAE